MTSGTRNVLTFLLGLRAIMLIGSAGAMAGALLMFLQGSSFLYHASFDFFSGRQVVVPVLEAVDAFLFGIVLVIFAYGIAISSVFSLPEGLWAETAELDEGRRRRPAQGDAGRGGDCGSDRDLRPRRGRHRGAFAAIRVADAGATGLDLSHRHRASHDRARRRERIAEYRRRCAGGRH